MAIQAARCLKSHLKGCPSKVLGLLTSYHSIRTNTAITAVPCAFNSTNAVSLPPSLSAVLRHSINDSDLSLKSIPFCHLLSRKMFFQRGQISVLSTSFSSKVDRATSFDNKDKCAVFDKNGMLIKETTFGQAKLLASNQNSRLVYMSKNGDGLLCFSLQQLPGKVSKAESRDENSSRLPGGPKKDAKAVAKEYKIKASIADRDLSIKMNQMQSHLSKGKQVIIFIKENTSRNAASSVSSLKCGRKILDTCVLCAS